VRGRIEPPAKQPAEKPAAPAPTPALFDARTPRYKPTQFLLDDERKAALKERSFRTDRSMSELVREAIDLLFQQ
jgi:hypothetical protein